MCALRVQAFFTYIYLSLHQKDKGQVFGFAPCMSYVNDVIKVWYEDVFICLDIEQINLFNCNIGCAERNNCFIICRYSIYFVIFCLCPK